MLDPLNYDSNKAAPNGSIEERHHWGQKNLGASYDRGLNWITNAEIVKDNIGNVVAVAPIDKPNFVTSSFTDGLSGNITIEVIGNKGRATFSAYGISPCSNGKTCFKRGILKTKGQEIAVHHTGISLEEFEKPASKIRYLSEKIEFYNRKYPQSKNNPFNSNPFIHKLWSERAEVYANKKEYNKALSDLEVALHLLAQKNTNISRFSAEKRQEYLERVALYNYFLAKYDESANAIKDAIQMKNILEMNRKNSDLHLWLWLARMQEGKEELTVKELKETIKLSAKNNNQCVQTIEIARFLVSDIEEKELLMHADTNPNEFVKNCGIFNTSRNFYIHYYIGQKNIINGKLEKGKVSLQQSLKHKGGFDYERDIAKYRLAQLNSN